MEDYNYEVGERIRQARKKIKMTMKELGERVGLHEGTISRYEKGKIQSLDIEKIKEFAKVLNVNVTYLLGWDVQPLIEMRQKQRKALTEVAKETHIDVTLLKQYEDGEKTIPFDVIKRLADYYGTSVETMEGLVFRSRGDEPLYNTSDRISATAKRWQDEVGETRFSDDEMTELINFAKYLISKRK